MCCHWCCRGVWLSFFFFFSSRRRHTRWTGDWSSDVCSSDLQLSLAIVGFAYYARELRPEALAELSWHTYEYGTNLQHGLLLARRILARQRSANKEIVVITDGEPTAHFEGGQVEFSYPPTRRTIQETLREVVRCTKEGITINTFMLERTPALTDFIGYVTELNRGRAFYAEPENLGEYVLVDFVKRRTQRLS